VRFSEMRNRNVKSNASKCVNFEPTYIIFFSSSIEISRSNWLILQGTGFGTRGLTPLLCIKPPRWPTHSHQKPTSYTVSPAGHQFFLSINALSVGSIDRIVWPKKLFQKKPPNLYVKVRVGGQLVPPTRVVKRSATPAWNEEFPV
jgi:hypothetical protein